MGFDGPKPLKNIEKQTHFLILGNSKNNEKMIQKGFPKSIKFVPKWSHGRGRVDSVGVQGRFWRDRKKYDFSIGKKSIQNQLKSILRASRGPARHIDARVRQVKVPGAAANYQRNRLNR